MSGQNISMRVATTLDAYRIVTVRASSTGNFAFLPTSTQSIPLGVTVDTVLDTVNSIPVQISGIAKLYMNDTCTAGTAISFDTSGRGILYSATGITQPAWCVGICLKTIDATGQIADVLWMPHKTGY